MALELHFQEQVAESAFNDDRGTPVEKWKTFDDEGEDNLSGGFECNICLDLVHDPVVTFCGHLYCWPCIYKWIQSQSNPSENSDQQHPQCPVCKAEISHRTLIPLYGRGQAAKPSDDEVPSKSMVIPHRPPSPRCRGHILISATDSHPSQQHQSNPLHPQSHQPYDTTTDVLHPGGIVYARVFGSSSPTLYTNQNSYHLAGGSSLRMRRQLLHADRSLGRIYFFLLLCGGMSPLVLTTFYAISRVLICKNR